MGSTRFHPGSQQAVAGGEGEQSDSHVLRPRLFWTQGGRGTRTHREGSRSRGAELPERGLGNDKKQTNTQPRKAPAFGPREARPQAVRQERGAVAGEGRAEAGGAQTTRGPQAQGRWGSSVLSAAGQGGHSPALVTGSPSRRWGSQHPVPVKEPKPVCRHSRARGREGPVLPTSAPGVTSLSCGRCGHRGVHPVQTEQGSPEEGLREEANAEWRKGGAAGLGGWAGGVQGGGGNQQRLLPTERSFPVGLEGPGGFQAGKGSVSRL